MGCASGLPSVHTLGSIYLDDFSEAAPRVHSCGCLNKYVHFDLKDKKPKEQEKRGDFLHRPFSKKLDKSLPSHKQPSASLITQIQNTKALLKDRKTSKSGFPDKGGSAFWSCSLGVAVWTHGGGDSGSGKALLVHPGQRASGAKQQALC